MPDTGKWVIKRARRGKQKRPQWMLEYVAENGKRIVWSESYNNRGDAELAVAILIFEGPRAPVVVVDETLEAVEGTKPGPTPQPAEGE